MSMKGFYKPITNFIRYLIEKLIRNILEKNLEVNLEIKTDISVGEVSVEKVGDRLYLHFNMDVNVSEDELLKLANLEEEEYEEYDDYTEYQDYP